MVASFHRFHGIVALAILGLAFIGVVYVSSGGQDPFFGTPGMLSVRVADDKLDRVADEKATSKPESVESVFRFEIINRYPHDKAAYTQGLLYLGNDTLFESVGIYGQSDVRRVDLKTGRVVSRSRNNRNEFGEGLSFYQGSLWQLLWKTRTVHRYDPVTLKRVSSFSMPREFDFRDGWGLTSSSDGVTDLRMTQGEQLFVTDSGSKIYRVEFSSGKFRLVEKFTVRCPDNTIVQMPNELELINNSEILANIYGSDCIARINPHTGVVFGWIVADDLRRESLGPTAEILNGIAYDRSGDRLFVTGKRWSQLFEVKVVQYATLPLKAARKKCIPRSNLFRHR
eukprot:TRINITY_DN61626_c0_g1_i1.p1 TRINITY_DN61626_c0_g1~~TRINITY_DN61626_c0_g1_i1.p1  ORF type:complete len:356 (-),score=12.03 TRINITY_DN61626_c0_g1_i1:138-1157(-)